MQTAGDFNLRDEKMLDRTEIPRGGAEWLNCRTFAYSAIFIWHFQLSKSRLAKAVGAEPAGQMRDEKLHAVVARSTFASELFEVEMSKKCTPLWHEAHFQAKMYKTHHSRTTFGNWDVEKVHAVVVRSTFRSQNVKNTRVLDHFWTLRCRFAWQVWQV